jgi:Fe2+ or Zn2+ uptake regulation protein
MIYNKTMQATRNTKYSKEIENILELYGHATNSQILKQLNVPYPEVTATTVHRVTTRLAERGVVTEAPRDKTGATRYDSNTLAHDHFICNLCDGIRDIDIAKELIPKISNALGGCKITGRLVINGNCEACLINYKEVNVV